jgi:hypothetical protein
LLTDNTVPNKFGPAEIILLNQQQFFTEVGISASILQIQPVLMSDLS